MGSAQLDGGYSPMNLPGTPARGLSDALRAMRAASSPRQFENAVSTMSTLLHNVLRAPAEPKYRRIKLSNEAVKKRITSLEGGLAALQALSFAPDPSGEVLVLPDEISMEHLAAAEVTLREFSEEMHVVAQEEEEEEEEFEMARAVALSLERQEVPGSTTIDEALAAASLLGVQGEYVDDPDELAKALRESEEQAARDAERIRRMHKEEDESALFQAALRASRVDLGPRGISQAAKVMATGDATRGQAKVVAKTGSHQGSGGRFSREPSEPKAKARARPGL